jgi:hypothetical protein
MKYYISSGDLKAVVSAEDEHEAMAIAFENLPSQLKTAEVEFLDEWVKVSELGFEIHPEDDVWYPTNHALGMNAFYHLFDSLYQVVLTDNESIYEEDEGEPLWLK